MIVGELVMMPRHDDLRLAQRCIAGEREAQRELMRAHRQRVHRILFRVLGTNRGIEDLVQEALLELFRSLGSYRGEASLATWIDRVTTRVAYRHISSRKAPPLRLEVAHDVDSAPLPDRVALAREAVRRLYHALDALDPKYRVPYVLHVLDGRSLHEVADLVGISPMAAKTRVFRARASLEQRAERDPVLADYVRGGSNR